MARNGWQSFYKPDPGLAISRVFGPLFLLTVFTLPDIIPWTTIDGAHTVKTVKLEPHLQNVSGIGHGPIAKPWPINHENAQFLDAVTKLLGWDDWNHCFREIILTWLVSQDEDQRLNIASHLDQSSTIMAGFIRRLEIEAETNEQLAGEIRQQLEDLQTVHDFT